MWNIVTLIHSNGHVEWWGDRQSRETWTTNMRWSVEWWRMPEYCEWRTSGLSLAIEMLGGMSCERSRHTVGYSVRNYDKECQCIFLHILCVFWATKIIKFNKHIWLPIKNFVENKINNFKYNYYNFKKLKYLAYSSQGSYTGQLNFCNWLTDDSATR